jgi:small-conductance mechanosensitive channel
MPEHEHWALAVPVLAALGTLLVLSLIGWLVFRRRAVRELIRLPFFFLSVAVAALVFLRTAPALEQRGYVLGIAIAALAAGVIHFVVTLIFVRIFSRRREILYPPLLRNVLLGLIYIAILLLAIKGFVPEFSLTPMLVTSGILSLIVGLALQDILGNFLAGVVLTIEKAFRTDDWIRTGELRGKVVAVTWRTTKLRTMDNDYLIIPNRLIGAAELTNYNYPTTLHRVRVQIGLPYETLPKLAEDALLGAAQRVEGVRKRPAADVFLLDFADSSITYELAFWVDDPDNRYLITSNVRREIFYSLKRHGISVPFPIRHIYSHEGREAEQVWKESYHHRLTVVAGPVKGLEFPVQGEELVIGRAEECGVELRDPSISKQHARLVRRDERWLVEDMGSRHGTLLNDRPVEGAELLRSGDEVRVGGSTLRFEEIIST